MRFPTAFSLLLHRGGPEVGEMHNHREAAFLAVILETDHAALHRNEAVVRGDGLRLLLGERNEPAHELEAPHRVVTAPARRIAADGKCGGLSGTVRLSGIVQLPHVVEERRYDDRFVGDVRRDKVLDPERALRHADGVHEEAVLHVHTRPFENRRYEPVRLLLEECLEKENPIAAAGEALEERGVFLSEGFEIERHDRYVLRTPRTPAFSRTSLARATSRRRGRSGGRSRRESRRSSGT